MQKKQTVKPMALKKLEVCRNLNVVTAVGEIRTEKAVVQGWLGRSSVQFSEVKALQVCSSCVHVSLRPVKGDRWIRG